VTFYFTVILIIWNYSNLTTCRLQWNFQRVLQNDSFYYIPNMIEIATKTVEILWIEEVLRWKCDPVYIEFEIAILWKLAVKKLSNTPQPLIILTCIDRPLYPHMSWESTQYNTIFHIIYGIVWIRNMPKIKKDISTGFWEKIV